LPRHIFKPVAALIGDGWWDALSLVSLTVPVLLQFFFALPRNRVRRR
jgi:hypothetical protein